MASSPFPPHLPTSRPPAASKLPGRRAALEGEQADKYKALLEHVSADGYALPSTLKALKSFNKHRSRSASTSSTPRSGPATPARKGTDDSASQSPTSSRHFSEISEDLFVAPHDPDELVPLSNTEKCWLSSEQLQRFLRAVKWNLKSAIARTEETIVWRREFGVDSLSAEDIEEESKTGKEIILGYDFQGRPLMHMYPYRQNTKTSPRQIQFVVWILERTVDLMPPGVETICLCIDCAPEGGGQPTPIGQATKTLNILQTYYCERLGRAINVNVPTLFWAFFKLVGPFVDPVTKEKLVFTRNSEEARAFVPPENLEKDCFGGDLDFKYDHATFFPAITKLAAERRAKMLERWHQIGNNSVGASEYDLRGGDEEAVKTAESEVAHANGNGTDVLAEKVAAVQLDTTEPAPAS